MIEIKPHHRVTFINKLKIDETWKKWKTYVNCSEKEKKQINLRQLREDEIVLDYEHENYQDFLKKLKEDGYDKYIIIKTGSRGVHIHLFFSNLADESLPVRNKIRELFITKYKADLSKASEKTVISIEDTPHFKTLNKSEIIGYNEGTNVLEEFYIQKATELLANQPKEQEVQKEEFKDYFNNDNFWKILNKLDWTQMPESCEFNNVVAKNLGIAAAKSQYSPDEIKDILGTFFMKINGYNYAEFRGWYEKAKKGELSDYNYSEINKWCKEYLGFELYDTRGILIEDIIKTRNIDDYIILAKELEEYKEKEQNWIVKGLIPSRSIGFYTGKRGAFKTFLALHLADCVSTGKLFLNKFETNIGNVLYIDRENGPMVLKPRYSMIKTKDSNENIGFIFDQIKIDKLGDSIILEQLIEKFKPALCIIDTLRRVISFKEDSADEVSKFFVDTLKPIVEKTNCSIMFIHHDKKGESGDEMDDMRGSSDLANYVDFILKNQRKGKELILKQLKSRASKEIEHQSIIIDTDEESYMKFYCEKYDPKNKDEKLAEKLIIWFARKNINTFKAKDAQEYLKIPDSNRMMLRMTLGILEERGLIKKGDKKGYYDVM